MRLLGRVRRAEAQEMRTAPLMWRVGSVLVPGVEAREAGLASEVAIPNSSHRWYPGDPDPHWRCEGCHRFYVVSVRACELCEARRAMSSEELRLLLRTQPEPWIERELGRRRTDVDVPIW